MSASPHTPMADRREELERLFVSSLPSVQSILGIVARRHRLPPDQVEDFNSWAMVRLIADDYEILGKFRGESAFTTYLTSVATALLRDYRHAVDGRWRSSASAIRAGALGVQLERLLVRDRLSLRQAGEMLRTSRATTLGDRQLAALASSFPRRRCLRPVQYLADIESCVTSGHHREDEWEDVDATAGTQRELIRALNDLTHEEQKLIKLVFWKDMSIADVAKMLAIPQKPLYRRLERIFSTLRRAMERNAEGARTSQTARLSTTRERS